jgi:hypothetical protein
MLLQKIQEAYKSNFCLIPENFDRATFVETENSPHKINGVDEVAFEYLGHVNDYFLALGAMYVFDKRGLGSEATYYVINSGARHLPLIAYFLKTKNTDPYFVLNGYEDTKPEFKKTATKSFLDLADAYSKIEIKELESLASLFCAHQYFDKTEWMPKKEKLLDLGIKHVVLLVEESRGLNYALEMHPEFRQKLEEYGNFDPEIYDIEPRLNIRDRKKILRFAKDDKLELLSVATGKSKSEIKRALRSFKL